MKTKLLRIAGGALLALAPALALADTPTPDKGDISWMMTATILVTLMTIPGLALFYGGMVRSKNVLSVLMQVMIVWCLGTVLWVVYGYSLAFTTGNAFIGGFAACTKDVLPYSKTVGNRALIYGLNTIGLVRRGFQPDTVRKLKAAYRYLLVSKLNTTRALARIEEDAALDCPEVRYLVSFIREAKRGVVLRRPARRSGESASDA